MLASLSNRRRTIGRVSLLSMLTALCAAGCSDPEINRAGTWKPTGINDQNLRAMLANPQDVYVGTGAITSRGDAASRAANRLLTDRRRALLDASVSHIGAASSGAADSGPAPSSGGGGSSGSAQ